MKTYKWIEVDEMIIKIMSGKYWNNYWHGYDDLREELWGKFECRLSEQQARFRIQALRKRGELVVKPTFSESTGMLCGSGYFINPHTGQKQK